MERVEDVKEKIRCSERVYPTGMGFPRAQGCARFAKVERNGKHYCKQHDPDEVTARRGALEEKWEAERRARYERINAPQVRIAELEGKLVAVRRLLVSLWKHQSGDMPINKNGELWQDIRDAATTDTSASPPQTQLSPNQP